MGLVDRRRLRLTYSAPIGHITRVTRWTQTLDHHSCPHPRQTRMRAKHETDDCDLLRLRPHVVDVDRTATVKIDEDGAYVVHTIRARTADTAWLRQVHVDGR